MLPTYLTEAILNWKDFTEYTIKGINEQIKEVKELLEAGKITEKEAKQEMEIIRISVNFRNTTKSFKRRSGKQDIYRHRIREEVRKALYDLELVLKHLEEIEGKRRNSKPIIEPFQMRRVIDLWEEKKKFYDRRRGYTW